MAEGDAEATRKLAEHDAKLHEPEQQVADLKHRLMQANEATADLEQKVLSRINAVAQELREEADRRMLDLEAKLEQKVIELEAKLSSAEQRASSLQDANVEANRRIAALETQLEQVGQQTLSRMDSLEKCLKVSKTNPSDTKAVGMELVEGVVVFKVLIIGDSATGKSRLMDRFTNNTLLYGQYAPTIGVEFAAKTFDVDGTRVKLQIWDTAGQERFRAITRAYYRGCHGVIIVYDVTERASFDHVKHWLDDIEAYSTENVKEATILVGNKDDGEGAPKEKVVPTEQGEALAEQMNTLFFETSAATGKNVENMFTQLARRCFAARKQNSSAP